MKRTLQKTLALLLALMMVLSAAPFAFADGDATITLLYSNGETVRLLTDYPVADGTAEAYGFSIPAADHTGAPITGVTVLDALVALHKTLYGDSFTKESAGQYLAVTDAGYITTVAGVKTGNVGFTVNDVQLHDDVVNDWGTYTGMSANEAPLKSGDVLNFFFYQDSYAMDLYPYINSLSAAKTTAEEEITISASGYSIGWYGCNPGSPTKDQLEPLAGADLMLFSADGTTMTKLATLDETGSATFKFEEEGTYWLAICGEDVGDSELPVIPRAVCVEIVAPPTALQRLINRLKTVFEQMIAVLLLKLPAFLAKIAK